MLTRIVNTVSITLAWELSIINPGLCKSVDCFFIIRSTWLYNYAQGTYLYLQPFQQDNPSYGMYKQYLASTVCL